MGRSSTYALAESVPPLFPMQKDAILQQLERLLSHPLFMHSKRYSPFLRYVVEHTLAGESYNLKERTLGIEVFGRAPEYDTSVDPIVRVTAGEIRKRIAQYYFEPAHESELRIELPPGSYVPEFHAPSSQAEPIPVAAPRTRFNKLQLLALIAAVIVFSAGILILRSNPATNALDQFWMPVLSSSGPVLVTVADGCGGSSRGGNEIHTLPSAQRGAPSVGEAQNSEDRPCAERFVPFTDVTTLSHVVGFLKSEGKPFELRGTNETSYSDLRTHPAVLIGGFDNPWTKRLCDSLRFSFKQDPASDLSMISDKQNPSSEKWGLPIHWPDSPPNQITKDYALIARLKDPSTEQMVVVAAGVGGYGSVAAGEFLSNPTYMQNLVAQAPHDWAKKNLQVVIETEVINGNSGPPHIVASHFW